MVSALITKIRDRLVSVFGELVIHRGDASDTTFIAFGEDKQAIEIEPAEFPYPGNYGDHKNPKAIHVSFDRHWRVDKGGRKNTRYPIDASGNINLDKLIARVMAIQDILEADFVTLATKRAAESELDRQVQLHEKELSSRGINTHQIRCVRSEIDGKAVYTGTLGFTSLSLDDLCLLVQMTKKPVSSPIMKSQMTE